MTRTVAPRNPILQYTQVGRATPAAFTPRAKFRSRHRRFALALTPTRPRSMHNARNLAGNRVRDRRVRGDTTARRRRRDRWGLQRGGRHGGGMGVLLMLAAQRR